MSGEFSRRRFLAAGALSTGYVLLGGGVSRSQTASVRVRKEIRALEVDELDKLRSAFRELQNTPGPSGYQKIAGYHGEPDHYCHNDSTIFLPWHRAYILDFESALRQIDGTVTLPYWDWTSADSIQLGIPKALADATYLSGGMMVPNPLHSAKIGPLGRNTARNPRVPVALSGLAGQVTSCYGDTSYADFNSDIDLPHGGLHTWVRGDMGSVPYAAYDPIFWFHHANVDRQWAAWQEGTNNAPPTADIMSKDLKPFGKKVRDVIDFRGQLMYEYEDSPPMPAQHLLVAERENLFQAKGLTIDTNRQVAYLVVNDLKPSATSYNVDVFIDQPDADEKTPLEGNPHYAGSFGIFGGGGHATHAAAAEVKKTQRVLNISRTAGRFLKPEAKTDLRIKFVITDLEGKPVALSKLPFKSIAISAE